MRIEMPTSTFVPNHMLTINHFNVAYKIDVKLKDDREFTATVQYVDRKSKTVIFMFDECIDEISMTEYDTFIHGLTSNLPEHISKRLNWITLPCYEQLIGKKEHIIFNVVPNTFTYTEQFELMKNIKNRIFTYKDILCPYWLMNSVQDNNNEFAFIGSTGGIGKHSAEEKLGVVPIFELKFKE